MHIAVVIDCTCYKIEPQSDSYCLTISSTRRPKKFKGTSNMSGFYLFIFTAFVENFELIPKKPAEMNV
jgi:hypothetical protein